MPATATEPRYRPDDNLAPPADSTPARAPRLPCPVPKGREQYLSAACEAMRLTLLADTAKRWSDAAAVAPTESAYAYRVNRAAALRRPLANRLRACGTVLMQVACGGGRRALAPRPCRQWWVCPTCRRRRANALRRRITDGLASAWSSATSGGRRAALRLSTFTVRHSGDLGADRARLAAAWRTFYRAVNRWLGRFAYVGVWEVTAGRDGLGHPHLHVAWVGPRFVAYARLARLWRAAIGDPKARPPTHVISAGTVERCANYLGKYLSKGVEVAGYTDELRARTLAAFYNAHLVLTSHRFWRPKVCDCCGTPWRIVVPWSGDVLGRDSCGAQAGAGPPEDGGACDVGGVQGSQRALELPDRFGLVLHRW